MEITDVDVYTMNVPLGVELADARTSVTERYWVVVELETDAGHVGTGWMGTWREAGMFERYTKSAFADLLVGRDPFHTESILSDMRDRTLYYPGEVGMSANPRAAIDVALWDLKAKASGQPLYALLGGEDRRVRAYASQMDANLDVDDLARVHGEAADRGFTAFKTRVGNRSAAEDARRVGAVREAIGPEADLFVDANQAWTVKEAIRTVPAIAEHDVTWVEEPVSAFDLDGYGRVADRIEPMIASGELFYRPERFEHLLRRGAMDVAQPDLIRGGGVTGQLAVARLAAVHHVPLAPHIYYAVSAHLVSAAPTGWLVEYIPAYDAGSVLENAPTVDGGYVELSEEPGHGYRIDPDAREEYGVSFA